jgi:hypothetical protein
MLKILTDNGHVYNINEKNQIIRTDMEFTPFDSWRFIKLIDRYHHEIEIDRINIHSTKLQYKNGKGRAWLIDFDHGTRRIWGDRIRHVWNFKGDTL